MAVYRRILEGAFWTPERLVRVADARTFEELHQVAAEILPLHAQPLGMLCGPISSGGEGSVEENLAIFEVAIMDLWSRGFHLFNQLPFEPSMHRIIREERRYYKGSQHLLETFYLPLFESGFFQYFIFLPTWETSNGARWEREQALRLGIPFLPRPELSGEWYESLKNRHV